MHWIRQAKVVQQLLYHIGKEVVFFLWNLNKLSVYIYRLSAIQNADRIMFIEKGRIVEDGTHAELIEKQGAYYNMMKSSHSIDSETDTNEGDNENIVSPKLVVKQMFTESQQMHDTSHTGNL